MTNEVILRAVKKAGLTEKETLVYSYLLSEGGAFPSAISEATGLNRSTTYKILLDLSIKGLVNEIEKHKKIYYQIENPKRLLDFLHMRERLIRNEREATEQSFSVLESAFLALDKKPRVLYFEGKEEVVNVWKDHISVGKYEMVGFANANRLREFIPKSFFDRYVREKEEIGITTRGILPDTPEDRAFVDLRYSGIKKNVWPHMKFANKDSFPYEAEFIAYGTDKISIIQIAEQNPVGVIIQDKIIHGMFRMIFELAWQSARE